jgi:hypothetical protein
MASSMDVVKGDKGLTALTPGIDCDQTAIGLPSASAVFLITVFGKMWVSWENI